MSCPRSREKSHLRYGQGPQQDEDEAEQGGALCLRLWRAAGLRRGHGRMRSGRQEAQAEKRRCRVTAGDKDQRRSGARHHTRKSTIPATPMVRTHNVRINNTGRDAAHLRA